MKITNVKHEFFHWPRSNPLTNGMHTYTHCGLSVATIETDEGITGYGFSGPVLAKDPFLMLDVMKETLIGEDPLNTERIWKKLYVPKLIGRRGMSTRAISGMDIALWDIKAKVANMPLYKLLGGFRDHVPAYIAGGYYGPGKGIKELQEEMAGYISQGVAGVKMKVGALGFAEDAVRVKAVREAIGPNKILMLDANCAYRYHEAIQFAKHIEEYNIYCFEEPVAPDDYDGMKKIAAMTTIPLAAGENEYTKYGFRDLILTHAVPILNPAPFLNGGVTETMKMAAFAQAFDLEIAPHGDQTINVSIGAAVPNVSYVEYYPKQYDALWNEIFDYRLTINSDGTISPPNRPGIGFAPNYEVLNPHRVR
ncbi:MAG: mandelate racemase/muconate lactonizing enzyme family protein [Negativicutes bacterium]|nr:mandelate racemase/muconate lactonizing enzyme family protein [Negativicutes bacterium]